jgi:hypothetical protein
MGFIGPRSMIKARAKLTLPDDVEAVYDAILDCVAIRRGPRELGAVSRGEFDDNAGRLQRLVDKIIRRHENASNDAGPKA